MAIGDFPATDAERLCFGTVSGADPAQRSLWRGAARVPAALSPASRHPRFPAPQVLLAVLSRLSVTETPPIGQSLGHAEKYV